MSDVFICQGFQLFTVWNSVRYLLLCISMGQG